MSLTSLGLVRGLIGQLLGTLLGMFLAMAVRLLMGLPAWSTEPVWVTGIAFGVIGFLIALGILDDWFLWTRGTEVPLRHGPPSGQPAWTRYFGVDYNHKVIGIQYGVTGILLLMIGGTFAVVFRTELEVIDEQFSHNLHN